MNKDNIKLAIKEAINEEKHNYENYIRTIIADEIKKSKVEVPEPVEEKFKRAIKFSTKYIWWCILLGLLTFVDVVGVSSIFTTLDTFPHDKLKAIILAILFLIFVYAITVICILFTMKVYNKINNGNSKFAKVFFVTVLLFFIKIFIPEVANVISSLKDL